MTPDLRARPSKFALAAVFLASCVDERAKPKPIRPIPAADSGPIAEPRKPDGCAKSGSLEMLASDPACFVDEAGDEVNREAVKRVAITLSPDLPSVPAGTNVIFRLVITNTSKSEAVLVFDVPSTTTGVKPDWTRLGGVPAPKGPAAEGHRLSFHVRTLDTRDHNVDGLPSTVVPEPTPKLMRVRLAPGAKLTHAVSWWALRIPPPMPIYKDDAGRRIVPKTAPTLLPSGDYTVSVEVPLHGLCPAECAVRAPIHVERATKKP